jgi:Na+-transporting NADH:ubiquinone oxidoreductase subunit NqrB
MSLFDFLFFSLSALHKDYFLLSRLFFTLMGSSVDKHFFNFWHRIIFVNFYILINIICIKANPVARPIETIGLYARVFFSLFSLFLVMRLVIAKKPE